MLRATEEFLWFWKIQRKAAEQQHAPAPPPSVAVSPPAGGRNPGHRWTPDEARRWARIATERRLAKRRESSPA